jgi:hypothetical protein
LQSWFLSEHLVNMPLIHAVDNAKENAEELEAAGD